MLASLHCLPTAHWRPLARANSLPFQKSNFKSASRSLRLSCLSFSRLALAARLEARRILTSHHCCLKNLCSSLRLLPNLFNYHGSTTQRNGGVSDLGLGECARVSIPPLRCRRPGIHHSVDRLIFVFAAGYLVWLQHFYKCPRCGKRLPEMPTPLESESRIRHYCGTCNVTWSSGIGIGVSGDRSSRLITRHSPQLPPVSIRVPPNRSPHFHC